MKKIICIITILIMLICCGCQKGPTLKEHIKDDAFRIDIDLQATEGYGCAPLIIRDADTIKKFSQFVNNAPILKQNSLKDKDKTDGNHNTVTIKYNSGKQSTLTFSNSIFRVDDVEYVVQKDYFQCMNSAIGDLEFNVDFVSLGDFLQLLSDTANTNTEYDTTGIQLGLGLTPQGANEIIGIFLKENGYSLDVDVLSELSLTDKKILYTKEAHDICDAVLQKLTK